MRCAILAGLAGCSFERGAVPSSSMQQIVDDTAQDLAAGTATGLEIDPLGWLAPEAYIAGGLHARGYLSTPVTDTTSWDDLTPAALGPIAGERYGEPPTVDWSTDRPYGLGLGRVDYFTVVYDGEIYLDGPVQLQLEADDFGFVDINLGAVSVTLRASYNGLSPIAPISPPAPGWYPIRGAITEAYSYASMVLTTVDANGTTRVDSSRFRARVTAAPGVIVSAAQSRIFAAPSAGDSVETSLVQHDFGSSPPSYDFSGLYASNYAMRYAGQLRVDHDGLYGFTIAIGSGAGDFARLVIDGITIAGQWPGQVGQLSNAAVSLTAGWHDLLFDYSQYDGAAQVELDLVTPGGAGPIPADHLRPVRTGGAIAYASGGSTLLADASGSQPGVTTVPLTITAPDAAVVDFVDLRFYLSGATRTDLALDLDLGAKQDPMPLPTTPAFDDYLDYLGGRTVLAGVPPAGTWNAVFTDNVPGNPQGTVSSESLVVSYHGGPGAPFVSQMTYVSAMHPTPGATAIGPITVTGELHGAALMIEVRTSGDWVPVESGAAPAVDPGDTIQYRLTITSDGWQAPRIDRIELDYAAS